MCRLVCSGGRLLPVARCDMWRGESWGRKGEWGRERKKEEEKGGKEGEGEERRDSSLGGLVLVGYSVMPRQDRLYLSVLSKFKPHFLWVFKGSGHKYPLSDLDLRICFTPIHKDSTPLPFLSAHWPRLLFNLFFCD